MYLREVVIIDVAEVLKWNSSLNWQANHYDVESQCPVLRAKAVRASLPTKLLTELLPGKLSILSLSPSLLMLMTEWRRGSPKGVVWGQEGGRAIVLKFTVGNRKVFVFLFCRWTNCPFTLIPHFSFLISSSVNAIWRFEVCPWRSALDTFESISLAALRRRIG